MVMAFTTALLKTNARGLAFAQRVRQRALGTLWQRCGGILERGWRFVGAPGARCTNAL